MNCPSRTDNVDGREGWNQNPNHLSNTTRQDLNGIANSRMLRRSESEQPAEVVANIQSSDTSRRRKNSPTMAQVARTLTSQSLSQNHVTITSFNVYDSGSGPNGSDGEPGFLHRIRKIVTTFGRFIGPGFMISVAYIDPGNYATDVAAGASYQFKLLFIVLMSNIFAIFLQSLCIKLGSVTGMDLAQMCRASLPKWLNYFLYFMAEGAIIATDIAEVIGTAIAINLLIPRIPLVAGCAISILDVLLILLFYRPNGSMKGLRAFELFVAMLVLGVVVCFIIQLTLIHETSVGDVFRGYLPSSAIIEADGLYQACGILGATVMPHSLYLGSGIVQPRLLEYDVQKGHVLPPSDNNSEPSISSGKPQYQPSLSAINFCLKYSIIELAISLFTFALFVNSAILIVAGASLYGNDSAADASLFSIYDLLSESIAPIAGTIFALALLLSGISAGIVCTIAGQMVSEGALNWTISPWMRRLVTRSISITPSIIIAGAVGKDGLTAALNGSQVALSIALPFISAPIIYFTCRSKYMTVSQGRSRRDLLDEDEDMVSGTDGVEERRGSNEEAAHAALGEGTIMKNNWITTGFAILVWLVIACMNIANLVLLGLGK